jgi:hypothetical protein
MPSTPRAGARFEASTLAVAGLFLLVSVALLGWLRSDLRPAPLYRTQAPHERTPLVPVTRGNAVELRVELPRPAQSLLIPVGWKEGQLPMRISVRSDANGDELLQRSVSESGTSRLDLPARAAPVRALRIRFSSAARNARQAPRLVWAEGAPGLGAEVSVGGVEVDRVEVLPDTGPMMLVEYPWPTRSLLWLWPLLVLPFVRAWREPRRAVGFFALLALLAALTSVLLWQRDYSRKAVHIDADLYASSAISMAHYITEPARRAEIREWYRNYPHASTSLAPALLVLPTILGAPVIVSYLELSALAGFLSLLVLYRILRVELRFEDRVALLATTVFGCHLLMLRSFARPVTDVFGLVLVLLTLWLLLRRLRGADRAGEIALSVLLFCHPMARPQGFAYWPFVALAVLACDWWRAGRRPDWRAAITAQLRIFLPPLLLLAGLYLAFDWLHNVELMMAKAKRFRINSTPRMFAESLIGIVQLLPLLWLAAKERLRSPAVLLLLAWLGFNLALIVAVRAPFWMRHFLPILPVLFVLTAAGLERLRGGRRNLALGLLALLVVYNVSLTVYQIYHSGPLSPVLERFISTP